MTRFILAVLVAASPALLLAATGQQAPAALAPVASHVPVAPAFGTTEQNAMVKQYCVGCHSDRGKAGGLTLAAFDANRATDHVALTEKMIRKLRAQMMPPAGSRRPEADQILALATALETRIDRAAALRPNPGSRPFQRLNRSEYARAVKDLLALDIDQIQCSLSGTAGDKTRQDYPPGFIPQAETLRRLGKAPFVVEARNR